MACSKSLQLPAPAREELQRFPERDCLLLAQLRRAPVSLLPLAPIPCCATCRRPFARIRPCANRLRCSWISIPWTGPQEPPLRRRLLRASKLPALLPPPRPFLLRRGCATRAPSGIPARSSSRNSHGPLLLLSGSPAGCRSP